MIRIKRGLDLPIAGAPKQHIETAPPVRSVALLGPDYPGLKPAMAVQVGERVQPGQLLFTDRRTEGVRYTAPAAGVVSAIHRGAKRVLLSVVIDTEPEAETAAASFPVWEPQQLLAAQPQRLRSLLLESGLWTALRTRPYSKVPVPASMPRSLFVNAMDTNPLAAEPAVVIGARSEEFHCGLLALCRLLEGRPVFLCQAPGAQLPLPEAQGLRVEEFAGPHPAGLAGTHIHFLDPVSENRTVWTIGCQDVIAIGQLLLTGCLSAERVVALAGPQVERPRLLRTRLGADLEALAAGQTRPGDNRLISGSPLSGHHAHGALAFLGRYHSQATVLEEGRRRELFGWLRPGLRSHSSMGIYLSHWLPGLPPLPLDTSTNGSERAMVPTGNYERVMPLDILPTHLLRYLAAGDTAMARQLGCLELDEEDLALCTYVCSGKYEYGPILRDHLTRIEREG